MPFPAVIAGRTRYVFIDLFRSTVIFLMLEGHVARTLLSASLQQTSLFQLHEFVHGLTAPAFLFAAGLTFVISTRHTWQAYHHPSLRLARRAGRILLILGLGLFLHLPFFSLRKILREGSLPEMLQLFQCDVLACIGIGLALLHFILYFMKSERRFHRAVAVLAGVIVLGTPIVWEIDVLNFAPVPVAQLLNGKHGSPFPLFPYLGFLLVGVLVSKGFIDASVRGQAEAFRRRMLLLGAGLLVAGIILDAVPVHIYPVYDFWFTSPDYFLIRAGLLMAAFSGFMALSARLPAQPRVLTVLGRESLFVYILHLLIIYGSSVNPRANLQAVLGGSSGVALAAAVFVGLTVSMLFSASLWNYLRRERPWMFRLVQIAAGVLFIYRFLANPW